MRQEPAVLVVLEELLELLAHVDLHRLVGRGLGPQAHLVLPLPHVHHHAAYLVALAELLADARQQLRMLNMQASALAVHQ